MYVHTDYHTHTSHSHGVGTVEENVVAAYRKGLRGIGISDHGPANLFGIGVRNLTSFERIRQEIQRVRSEWPRIQVYFGVEANVISTEGHLDVPVELQPHFDYVMVGLHPMVLPLSVVQAGMVGWSNLIGRWSDESSRKARIRNTDALLQAVYRNRVHVVTHPGYRLSIDTRELAKACAHTGTAMEINASHDHITVEYIEIAASEGAQFVIGSDAHSPERIGDFSKALALANMAGLTSREVINAVGSD